ncbi:MAG: hypothetical protein C0507_21590 [Cyanobacteria bacterium PR.3.49]|nr:hypothetical protein [Cyanobacteria bacterium PR.3.49]
MFGSGKAAGPRNVRLPKQSAMPSYGDVEFLSQEAKKIIGRWVELPWTSSDRKQDFILSVRYEHEQGDPNWAMFELGLSGNVEVWNYATRDISLICNLLATASGSNSVEDFVPSSALLGKASEVGTATVTATVTNPTIGGGMAPVTFEPPRPGAKATLEGDLKNLQVPNLLQSINLAKMTGKLDIRTRSEKAEIFFVDGNPVHASLKDVKGDSALIELITWQVGEFRFWPDEQTAEKTVTRRLDAMLMEGVTLLDQSKYLDSAGLKMESVLVKKNAMISEEEFQARLSKGAPLDLTQQLDFYELIDNKNSLFDLLRKRPMNKVGWVPILFNLVSCGLVQVTDQAPQQSRLANLKALGIDEAAIQQVTKNLLRPETGILTYHAFIYYLDQEYLRYEYFNLPFSLLIFSMGLRKANAAGGTSVEALQMLGVRRAMQRIGLVKRQVDQVGHYETFDYAILLPNTNSMAAGALANRIVSVLLEAPLSSDMDSRSLALAFGVATVPEDCQELDKLIVLAKRARDRAKQGQNRVVLARDVLQPGQQAPPPPQPPPPSY